MADIINHGDTEKAQRAQRETIKLIKEVRLKEKFLKLCGLRAFPVSLWLRSAMQVYQH